MNKFILVKHDAIKKGTHYDLRFEIPGDKNWRSFVFNSFPPSDPGKKVYIPEAPIHSEKNALSLEPIPAGEYGAGKFTKIDDDNICDAYCLARLAMDEHKRGLSPVNIPIVKGKKKQRFLNNGNGHNHFRSKVGGEISNGKT